MKYIKYFCLVVLTLLLVTGCSGDKVIKSEYSFNENATLDNFDLKLLNATYDTENNLFLTFQVANNSKDIKTIDADTNFKYYQDNEQLKNYYSNFESSIDYNKSITYTLEYKNVEKKDNYEILFYSGVVENNIRITFTKDDIK